MSFCSESVTVQPLLVLHIISRTAISLSLTSFFFFGGGSVFSALFLRPTLGQICHHFVCLVLLSILQEGELWNKSCGLRMCTAWKSLCQLPPAVSLPFSALAATLSSSRTCRWRVFILMITGRVTDNKAFMSCYSNSVRVTMGFRAETVSSAILHWAMVPYCCLIAGTRVQQHRGICPSLFHKTFKHVEGGVPARSWVSLCSVTFCRTCFSLSAAVALALFFDVTDQTPHSCYGATGRVLF